MLALTETSAEAQRRFARDNHAIADRLDAAGHLDLAAVFRGVTLKYADCAGCLEAGLRRQAVLTGEPHKRSEAVTVAHFEGTKPHEGTQT